ncbi:MAG TPA: isoaspartyl peptidase/L-asparaginase [Longimicrobiales bacterium]|nr:isoaspartyl peptidase/L-asparaginase [Longimicrobiales bacterium]
MAYRRIVLFAAAIGLMSACAPAAPAPAATPAPAGSGFGMVIHGGAGTITRATMTDEMEAQFRSVLEQALRTGHRILESGGTSLDAVEATVRVMEDSPIFNAGRGAVFTSEGRNELDAAIMDGRTLQAGAVAGITRVRNPISLARAVMEKSPHVMMIRDGAEAFAREQGHEMVPETYFFTENRWNALRRALEAEGRPMPARPAGTPPPQGELPPHEDDSDRKFGTVGAVALDRHGNLAAATSTGGMTNKRFGRVGDVPIIGAGTYANTQCAVSATGHGEFFIRNIVAYDICARMAYTGVPLDRAAHQVVMERLVQQGGDGGIIAMDAAGNHTMTFNSEGMYRGHIDAQGRVTVAIYRDD